MREWTYERITDRQAGLTNVKLAKPVVFLACLVPITSLIVAIATNQLGANPLEEIRNDTGVWTLRFLIVTLAVTPLRCITGWHSLIRFRRMLGLFSFFYAFVHFVTYVWFDQFFAFDEMLKDLTKRRFIMAGYVSFVILIPLAITSTKKWIGRLGGKRWQLLHRFVYLSTAAGVVHYFWAVKLNITRPAAYLLLLLLFLAYRLTRAWRKPSYAGNI
jgi:sulfoxide reductase heme-binding subunit YedZ